MTLRVSVIHGHHSKYKVNSGLSKWITKKTACPTQGQFGLCRLKRAVAWCRPAAACRCWTQDWLNIPPTSVHNEFRPRVPRDQHFNTRCLGFKVQLYCRYITQRFCKWRMQWFHERDVESCWPVRLKFCNQSAHYLDMPSMAGSDLAGQFMPYFQWRWTKQACMACGHTHRFLQCLRPLQPRHFSVQCKLCSQVDHQLLWPDKGGPATHRRQDYLFTLGHQTLTKSIIAINEPLTI